MTTKYIKKIREGYEPFPGYALEEVIGRGGFGEVWRASAPGGLKKAIKFVFGAQDQSRALRELRSLERIKGVHHPFLLTLERFEIVDDQLTIVTELAEGSLEDVFKNHRENGSCGIPRDLLVSHLSDAADALDYLHQAYQLQHLDIKPGNLLMIGGHVKVADFGLLKDLRDADCSIVGGLTPIYAPPEVFDGRPSLHSDQYSLAVMYQELLTGTRPFSGRTIAQLATQHVHSAPNLEPLPPSDRPVAARALEKDPQRRFSSCKAFVEALHNPYGRAAAVVPGGERIRESTIASSEEVGPQVADLPQLNSEKAAGCRTVVHHALVVGLGGSGAECVRELRRRVANLHVACNLDLHSVVIDTDMATLHSMRLGEVSDRVPRTNVVYAPLRTANEYRQNGTDRLKTISRRWIYNVPRSGSTEGMRPLGRLALVDHGKIVMEKLQESISALAAESDGSLPSIYVVGSLAGGTGSGMYVDVVHLLRHLLDRAGLEEARILSMLSSAAFQIDPSHPLAMHDTQAAIHEIQYFLQPGNGYPGDEGAGWPSMPAARTPLRDIYVVSGSPHDRLAPSPVESISEYIWADATGCRDLLAAARSIENSEKQSVLPPSVRSVGVIPLGNAHRLEQKLLAPALVRQLMVDWLGLPSKAKHAAVPLAARLIRRVGMSSRSVLEVVVEHLSRGSHRERLERLVADLTNSGMEDHQQLSTALTPWVAEMTVNEDMDWACAGWLNNLYREVSVCLNDRRADVTTVIECLKLLQEKSIELASELRDVYARKDDDSDHEFVTAVASRKIAAIQLENFMTGMKFLMERLERFAAILAISIVEMKSASGDSNPWDEMPKPIRSNFEPLVCQLHNATANQHLVRPFNDLAANVDAKSLVRELSATALPLVIPVVEQHSSELLDAANAGSSFDDDLFLPAVASSISISRTEETQTLPSARPARFSDGPISMEDAVAAVNPVLLALGGLQRLIMVVGNDVERSRLEPKLRAANPGPVTIVVVPGAEPKLIHEAQQIDLKNILSRLTVLNGGNADVTMRLASRSDVAW